MKTVKKYRNIILRIIDIIVIAVAYYIAEILINNSFIITYELNQVIITTIILAIIIYSGFLHIFKTYKNTIIKITFNINMVNPRTNMIAALIIVTTIIGYRVVLRLILTENYKSSEENENNKKKNVLIIGAGDATRIVLRTLRTTMRDSKLCYIRKKNIRDKI